MLIANFMQGAMDCWTATTTMW